MSRKALKPKEKQYPPYSERIIVMGDAEARIVPPEEVEARKRAAAQGQLPPQAVVPGMGMPPGFMPQGQPGMGAPGGMGLPAGMRPQAPPQRMAPQQQQPQQPPPPATAAGSYEPLFRDHVTPERRPAGMGNVTQHQGTHAPLPQRPSTQARPSNVSATPQGMRSNVQSVGPAHSRQNFATQQQPQQPIQTSVQIQQQPVAAQTMVQVQQQPPTPAAQPMVQVQPPQPPQAEIVQAPVVGVTAIIATAFRPNILRSQLTSLFEGSAVSPAAAWIWSSFDDGQRQQDFEAIARYQALVIRCIGSIGPWPRLSLVADVLTPYVLLLDDDCIPGPQWLTMALDRLEHAEEGEALVIACEGARFEADDPGSLQMVTPDGEAAQEVDVGLKGWLAPTWLMQEIATGSRFPSMFGNQLFMGATATLIGAHTIILPRSDDSYDTWGSLPIDVSTFPYPMSTMEGANEALAEAYAAYRSFDWAPLCVPQVVQQEQDPAPTGEPAAEPTEG